MALKLMYITNRPEVALIAEKSGVDRIFVDLEYIGKSDRQGGMDTVQSKHSLDDVKKISEVITEAELLVRVNPIHDSSEQYCSSEEEINTAIKNGADIIMLPYFKTTAEVKRFIKAVDGRVKTMILLETPESVEIIDDILMVDGVDYIHIGLNDLSLGYGMKFMFQLLLDGTVDKLCEKFRKNRRTFGFGGIASIGKGAIPAEMIIKEHYRLGSTCAILSRSFCNSDIIDDINTVESIFVNGMREIRDFEIECENNKYSLTDNKLALDKAIKKIVE